ncbi:MAG: cyclic-di-AMP receptor [Clostridiales bacterium]|nr:cyclic-di-AMP receptor [Clostridiales bacterium]
MKMVMCVVDDIDAYSLLDALSEGGFMATKLASSGGFLRRGNTTLLIGVEDEKKDELLELVRKICKPRKQMVPVSPVFAMEESVIPTDVEIKMGGAVVFVLDVVENFKI